MSRKILGFSILIGCQCLGELLFFISPIKIPAPVFGMIILLILLLSGKIELSIVESTANTLIGLMLLLLVPAGVNLLSVYDMIQGQILALILTILISSVLVMITTARTIQYLRRRVHRS